MIAWVLYTVLVSTLLALAARVAEAALRGAGHSTRGVWVASLAGSLVLPALAWAGLMRVPVEIPVLPALLVGDAVAPATGAPIALDGLDPGVAWGRVIGVFWALASALVLVRLAGSALLLRRARRGWRSGVFHGEPVWLTRREGPAVVGWLRSRIVVPEWTLELDEALQRLMLRHEQEHVRAGDPGLLFGGLLVAAALPWNPLVWWQLYRLRLAVEADCDGRVLAATADVARYGSLLMEVGRRHVVRPLYAAALTEPKSMLERRIEIMMQRGSTPRVRRTLALAGTAALLVTVAVCAEQPVVAPEPQVVDVPDAPSADVARAEAGQDIAAQPTFTPFTVRPALENRQQVADALETMYPPLLREAGIGGAVDVWFFIDEAGVVRKTQLKATSGHAALDEAALKVAATMRFSPALNRAQPVPVWVQLPIVFQPATAEVPSAQEPEAPVDLAALRQEGARFTIDGRVVSVAEVEALDRSRIERIEIVKGAAARERGASVLVQVTTKPAAAPRLEGAPVEERVVRTAAEVAAAPTFTPFDERPDLANRREVAEALMRNYPPLLKDAGIGGTAQVWFLISETGRVERMQIKETSGHAALDDAALRVAATMRFEPARLGGRPTAVWIQLPISFAVK